MVGYFLEILFNAANTEGHYGLPIGEFLLAIGLAYWGYKMYEHVTTPSDSWDAFLKYAGIGLMAFAALDVVAVLCNMIT